MRVTVGLLIGTGSAILLARREQADGTVEYELPEGELAFQGETLRACAERIARDAVGLPIENLKLQRLMNLRTDGAHVMHLGMYADAKLGLGADATLLASGWQFHPLDVLPTPLGRDAALAVAASRGRHAVVDLDGQTLPLGHGLVWPGSAEAEIAVARARRGRWHTELLSPALLFGGAISWTVAVFLSFLVHELWTGGSLMFAFVLAFLGTWAVSVHFGWKAPAEWVAVFFSRAMATLVLGGILAGAVFLVAFLLSGGNQDPTLFIQGLVGIVTVVVVRRWKGKPRTRDPMTRVALACVWLTLGFVSVTALIPPLHRVFYRASDDGGLGKLGEGDAEGE